MTLKFEPEYMPPEMAEILNNNIGTFNDDLVKWNATQAEAYRVINETDDTFVRKFTDMAVKLRDAMMAVPIGEGESRADLFEIVREELLDELYGFQHGLMEFEFQFDEDGVNLDWWEASTC